MRGAIGVSAGHTGAVIGLRAVALARCPCGSSTPTWIGANSAPAKSEPERNPGGYCGLGGTGVACPIGLAVQPSAGT
jgi:hypothetical protein